MTIQYIAEHMMYTKNFESRIQIVLLKVSPIGTFCMNIDIMIINIYVLEVSA